MGKSKKQKKIKGTAKNKTENQKKGKIIKKRTKNRKKEKTTDNIKIGEIIFFLHLTCILHNAICTCVVLMLLLPSLFLCISRPTSSLHSFSWVILFLFSLIPLLFLCIFTIFLMFIILIIHLFSYILLACFVLFLFSTMFVISYFILIERALSYEWPTIVLL